MNAFIRGPLSTKLRFEVFKRDGFVCQYCGEHPPDVVLEVDHITPVVEGGLTTMDNLVTACFRCNRGKGSDSLTVVPQSLAEKAALILEREEQLAGYREIYQRQEDRIEGDAWRVAVMLYPGCNTDGIRRAWFRSIKNFNDKIGLEETLDAAEIALAQGPVHSDYQLFLYFCGVCWNKFRAKFADQNGAP